MRARVHLCACIGTNVHAHVRAYERARVCRLGRLVLEGEGEKREEKGGKGDNWEWTRFLAHF
jgi:hypothetical protein